MGLCAIIISHNTVPLSRLVREKASGSATNTARKKIQEMKMFNRVFFYSLLCICSAAAGVLVELDAGVFFTLGAAAGCGELLYNIGVSTLVDDVVSFGV